MIEKPNSGRGHKCLQNSFIPAKTVKKVVGRPLIGSGVIMGKITPGLYALATNTTHIDIPLLGGSTFDHKTTCYCLPKCFLDN